MENSIRDFEKLARFAKEHGNEALRLAEEWNRFSKKNPVVLSFKNTDDWYNWISSPDNKVKNIDHTLWMCKEIKDVLSLLPKDQSPQLSKKTILDKLPLGEASTTIGGALLFGVLGNKNQVMEEDKRYLKLQKKFIKEWQDKNPGKDFSSKEWLDFYYGSLENDGEKNLGDITENEFRRKNRRRSGRYDKNRFKAKKTPEKDPYFVFFRSRVLREARERYAYLKKSSPNLYFKDVLEKVEKKRWEGFVLKYPEKASAYSQDKYIKYGTEIKSALQRIEQKEVEKAKEKPTQVQKTEQFVKDISPEQTVSRLSVINREREETGLEKPKTQEQISDLLEKISKKREKTSRFGLVTPYGEPLSSETFAIKPSPSLPYPISEKKEASFLPQKEPLFKRFAQKAMKPQHGRMALAPPIPKGSFGSSGVRNINKITGLVKKARVAGLFANPVFWIIIFVILIIFILTSWIISLSLSSSIPSQSNRFIDYDYDKEVGPPIPGLELTKIGPEPVRNGESIRYTITVKYNGNLDVIIEDPIPHFTKFEDATKPYTLDKEGESGQVEKVKWRLKDHFQPESTGIKTIFTFYLVVKPDKDNFDAENQAFARAIGEEVPPPSGSGTSGNQCTERFEVQDGPCTYGNLINYFNDDRNRAITGSLVCMQESGGNPFTMNTNCSTGDYSIGLFQINLYAHCPEAGPSSRTCSFSSAEKRDACTVFYKNPENNIQKMLKLSGNGDPNGWKNPWATTWKILTTSNGDPDSNRGVLTRCGIL